LRLELKGGLSAVLLARLLAVGSRSWQRRTPRSCASSR